MPRPFYIIGHNPNTVEDAQACLKAGANGLEPDIVYHPDRPDRFYVHEQLPWVSTYCTLRNYLHGLRQLLRTPKYQGLAMIAFDLKNPQEYDINVLFEFIRAEFSVHHPNIIIGATGGNKANATSLKGLQPKYPKEFIGVDDKMEAQEAYDLFKPTGSRFSFGAGNSVFSTNAPLYARRITSALALRDGSESFSLVYPWTVNSMRHTRYYLDRNVDGMITDKVGQLFKLITTDAKYKSMYAIA